MGATRKVQKLICIMKEEDKIRLMLPVAAGRHKAYHVLLTCCKRAKSLSVEVKASWLAQRRFSPERDTNGTIYSYPPVVTN